MRRLLFFLLLAAVPLLSRADGEHGAGNKDRAECQKQSCRPHIQSVEEFGFMVPPPTSGNKCLDHELYHQAIINFYQWYLNNRYAIAAGLSNPDKQKDLIPPFQVSYETLYRFYQLIREKYPEWISDLVPDTNVSPPVQTVPLNAVTVKDSMPSDHAVQIIADSLSAT